MESYGSEIGQKMRSAVKAKLVELGTGGSAGYIDDELPDYVMIMVANKRSKQQMIADLNLFLGSQTELFVTWLHEVLQKLQEVTLPAASAATGKKRKTLHKDDAALHKKDKKDKKDRRQSSSSNATSAPTKRPTHDETENTTPPASASKKNSTAPPVINSITEVFAEELLEKAKKSLDVTVSAAAQIKKHKSAASTTLANTSATTAPVQPLNQTVAGFDIPTISEISSTTGGGAAVAANNTAAASNNNNNTSSGSGVVVSGNREKDLAELAAIQRKIYAAKKLLREIGEYNEDAVSDDGDFLNLKDDDSADELNEAGDLVQKPTVRTPRPKSPIVFDTPSAAVPADVPATKPTTPQHGEKVCDSSDSKRQARSRSTSASTLTRNATFASESRNEQRGTRQRSDSLERTRKRPVHERLGTKSSLDQQPQQQQPPVPTRDRRSRQEKELYVPAFRRMAVDSSSEREREREREREPETSLRGRRSNNRERSRDRDNRDRERERERERARDFERHRRDDDSNNRSKPEARFRPVVSTERRSLPVGGEVRSDKRRHEHSDDHEKSTNGSDASATASQQQQRHRIGSRVIVAPMRVLEPSDDEDLLDKPVNSVIKIKPRAVVSPSKQACKNLLLRAVAEAQRSTILSKPTATVVSKDGTAAPGGGRERVKVSSRLGQQLAASEPRGKLPLNRLMRSRLKRKLDAGINSAMLRRKNFVIEVDRGELLLASDAEDAIHMADDSRSGQEDGVDAEFVVVDEADEACSFISKKSRRRGGSSAELRETDASDIDRSGDEAADADDSIGMSNTQFVVTLNDEKSLPKYKGRKARTARSRSRSYSPLPKVSSSSSVTRQANAETTSTTMRIRASRSRSRDRHKNHNSSNNNNSHHHGIRARPSLKTTSSSVSPGTAVRLSGHESSHSSLTSSTPPPRRTTERIEVYRKPRDIKKIIIKNDSEDDDNATTTPKKGGNPLNEPHNEHNHQLRHKNIKRRTVSIDRDEGDKVAEEGSTTPPLPPHIAPKHRATTHPSKVHDVTDERRERSATPQSSPAKRKRTPIKFDLDSSVKGGDVRDKDDYSMASSNRRRSKSPRERDLKREDSVERRRKIPIRNAEARKYDNIPALSSVALDSSASRVLKPKERCKYHPNCTKQFCEFYHPTAPCKSFPNCKYADKCMYSHPKCKYDMSCTNIDCNFSHSGPRNPTQLQLTAPPLSSHVVPVQNYKPLTAVPPPAVANTMCRYYPNCNKVNCTFYHPKLCRFGKNCINKLECNFYHHDMQSSSKFKWVASVV